MPWAAAAAFLALLIAFSRNSVHLLAEADGRGAALELEALLLDGWVRLRLRFSLRREKEGLRLKQFIGGKEKPIKRKRKGKRGRFGVDAFLRELLKHARVERLRLRAELGAKDDAALTALGCGGAQQLYAFLFALCRRSNPRLVYASAVRPAFGRDALSLRLSCMAAFRLGHIMEAALYAAHRRGKGAKKTWPIR